MSEQLRVPLLYIFPYRQAISSTGKGEFHKPNYGRALVYLEKSYLCTYIQTIWRHFFVYKKTYTNESSLCRNRVKYFKE